MESSTRRAFLRRAGLTCAGLAPLAHASGRFFAQVPDSLGDSAPATSDAGGSRLACRVLPVHVQHQRVLRTVVGLRPYRPSGFVVRPEKVDDTLVIHNYGHGGAGITLSWGTAQLALQAGCQGTSGPVAG